MCNIELKTKSTITLIQPIADQILLYSSSRSDATSKKLSSRDISHKIEDIYSSLVQNTDSGIGSNNTELKMALQNFKTAMGNLQNGDENVKVLESLLLAVYDILVKKDSFEIEEICVDVKNCQYSLKQFMSSTTIEEIAINFKKFADITDSCMNKVGLRAQDLVSKKQQQVIILCASQIAKCLDLLRAIFGCEPDNVKLLKRYIYNCISWCFTELMDVLEAPKPNPREESEGCGGQFVHRMDLALEMLSSYSGKVPETELKTVIDDVLCHAMSIAQVAVASDCKTISASCQKVLRALDTLKEEYCSEGNPSVCNLYVNSLADSLEVLEQCVNTALLRLVLEVFCDFIKPRNILNTAIMSSKVPISDRRREDLEEFIVVFDLQMDRIMQIGLFAMACSEDVKRVSGIRSCLASLESLEPELIPSMTTYYLDPTKVSWLYYLHSLWGYWAKEVSTLAKLIDGIVDPSAFCQVTLDDVHVLVATMKSKLQRETVLSLKEMATAVSSRAKKLLMHLKISIAEVDQRKIPSNLPKMMDDFHLVCSECDAVISSVLVVRKESIDSRERERVLKRCELLVSILKKLQVLLVEMMDNSENVPLKTGGDAPGTPEESLQFPDSVSDLPVDEDSHITMTETSSTGNVAAEEIIAQLLKKSKLLTKERSILYFTPKSKQHLSINLKQPSIRRMHYRPINDLSSPDNILNENALDQTLKLEITSILDGLTFLSNTLTEKNNSVISVAREEPSSCLMQLEHSDASSHITQEDVVSSLTSHEVNTPQRIQDLQALQSRIDALKLRHSDYTNDTP